MDAGYNRRRAEMRDLARALYARAHGTTADQLDPVADDADLHDVAALLAAACDLRDRVVHGTSRREGSRVSRERRYSRAGSWIVWDGSLRPTWHPDASLENQP